MADLSLLVDADDEVVADLLTATLELVVEAGGRINPDVRLVARHGQLGIESDAQPGTLLVSVPRSALVRVDRVTWGQAPDRLEILDVPDDVGDAELQLLYVQAALHNQCGKPAWLARTHPAIAELPAPVVDAVRSAVPSFRIRAMSVADVLWATRCFRIALVDGAPERVLIPIVDLLNHDAGGAVADWDGSAFSVDVRRPQGQAECALDYGMDRDALELAVVYGFADETARVAHSPSMTVDVPDVGEVELDRLTFPLDDPAAPVRDVMAASGWPREVAADTVAQIAAETIERCERIIEACSAGGSGSACATLAAAAGRQIDVVTAVADVVSAR